MPARTYLNGEIIDADRAAVSADNPALLHGIGLFETLRAYGGRPFGLDLHIERLQNSAARFRIPVADVIGRIPEAVRLVLDENELTEARIRITVTPPPAGAEESQMTLLVTAQAAAGYAPELYQKGMTVYVCTEFRQSAQDPLAGHKTTSYLPRLIALRQAQEKKCGEALWFTPQNMLAEGCISNVFLVRDGKLRTPPLDTPVLPGVTRAIVIELAKQTGVEIEEAPSTINDVLDAEEVFLTNAMMEVMPVTHVERRAIGEEKPGLLTLLMLENYRRLVQQE